MALTSDVVPVSSKQFLHIQLTIGCGFSLKCVRDMRRIYIQEIISLSNKQK